ncbi:MAG: YecA family protein [Planctomycetota bacterium]
MNNKRKIGRNKPCHCGSGKKFKKCHGSLSQSMITPSQDPFSDPEIKKRIEQMKAEQIQREKQQGLGRQIISSVFRGYRLVAVGNKYFWEKEEKWKTFNEFLSSYIRGLFGQEWADVELKKIQVERHPLFQWYGSLCNEQKRVSRKEGELFETPVTGAIFAYLTLAYNLYLIAHNIHLVHGESLHDRLVERLKNKDSFYPAFYETMVASSFIKAGFIIELEDEKDSEKHHAEFTATSTKTKQKYSVEAKHRQAGKNHTGVCKQLYNALKKELPHKRVVFINLNIPYNIKNGGRLEWLDDVISEIRQYEDEKLDDKPAPQAYIFITNHPFLYNLDSCNFPPAAVAEGFKIPDFKIDSGFYNLREAINSRERHIDMLDLMRAMKEYDEIPCTFDGEIPEYAFGEIKEPRLIIGNKYIVQNASGKEVEAELVSCCVSEKEKVAYCMHKHGDGKTTIGTCPLSDKEIEVYRRYPDTFFGVHKKQSNRVHDALDMYDFLYNTYKNTSKEKLLGFLKGHPNIEKFKEMPQGELAKIYCEIMTYSAMRRSTPPSAPNADS